MISEITHYQTEFKVEHSKTEHSPLFTIQNILYGWLLRKEDDHRIKSSKPDFFKKCNWDNLYSSHSSIATQTVYTDSFKAWALRYTHRDSELGARRHWFVDVGVKEEKGNGIAIFSCRVSYARSPYDLTSEHLIPPSTTPRFIRDIVQEKSDLTVFSGEKSFLLKDKPAIVRPGEGKKIAGLIMSEDRRYALIVFNPDSEKTQKECEHIANSLIGKTQVFVLENNPDLAEEMRFYLARNLIIPRGKFRIYYPLNRSFPRPDRHRWFDPLAPDYPEKRESLTSNLLRVYQLEEVRSLKNISDVGRMITMEVLKKRLSESSATSSDMEELQDMWDDREKEHEEQERTLKQETENWISELEDKEDELRTVRAKLDALSFSCPTTDKSRLDLLPELKRHVDNLEEIVGVFSRIHEDKLLFSDEAFKSANRYQNCEVLDRAWGMLTHIATTLYRLKFEEECPGDIASRFRAESGFEYAKTEGKTSKADSAICASRLITVNGKRYEIWPHIKYGNKPPKALRIHFAFDEDLKKIVIGFVGDHMTNATTRSIK